MQVNASGVNAVNGLSEELSEELREITATPDGDSDDGISSGAIAAIVVIVLVVLLTLVVGVTAFVVYKKRKMKTYDFYRKNRHGGDDYVADVDVAFDNRMAPQEMLDSHVEQMISTEPEPFKMVDQKSADNDDVTVAMNPNADLDDTETHL